MTFIERIVDVQTGETTEREYTTAEIAKVEKRIVETKAEVKALEAKEVAKAALLERLGITEEEAALLLG